VAACKPVNTNKEACCWRVGLFYKYEPRDQSAERSGKSACWGEM